MSMLVRRSFLSITAAGLLAPAAFAQTPPLAKAEWAAIGQYGDKAAPFTVFENDGALHIDGEGFKSARLIAQGGGRYAIAGRGELVLEKGAVHAGVVPPFAVGIQPLEAVDRRGPVRPGERRLR